MFLRKKKNRSGTVSVVVVDKSQGRFKEIKTIGVSSSGYTGDVDPSNGHVDPLGILVNKKRTMTILQFFSETIAFQFDSVAGMR